MEEIAKREDALFEQVASLIEEARKQVNTAVNTAMVYTYYGVGRYIVEDELANSERAAYGKKVLKQLAAKLHDKYGDGWTADTLKRCRYFYKVYSSNVIGATSLPQLNKVSIPKDANVYASAYQLYIPDKALLQAKVKEWIAEFEEYEEIRKAEKN